MKEPLRLQAFKYADSPIEWELAPVDSEVTSLGQLLQRFYTLFDRHDVVTFNPLAWHRNPIQANGEPLYSGDNILVLYRRGYHVRIEKEGMFGPHPAFLYYRCQEVEDTLWLATLQISGMYYDDDLLRGEITAAIH